MSNADYQQVTVALRDGRMMVSQQQARLLSRSMTMSEAHEVLTANPGLYLCDFCSRPGVSWSYDAVDFDTGVPEPDGSHHVSRGGWAACTACHDLIERNDREGLADRSIEFYMEKHPASVGNYDAIRSALLLVHEKFWLRRIGEAKQTLPEPGSGLVHTVPMHDSTTVIDGRRRIMS